MLEVPEEEKKESPPQPMRIKTHRSSEPMTAQKISQILAFLEDLRSDPQSAAFNMPVNWRALNIPDYPQIVKNPMDLQTLETKVRSQNIYTSVQDFLDDLALIWSNCKLFN